MRSLFFVFLFFLLSILGMAQPSEPLRLTITEIESLFLQNNIEIIAEQLNIDLAEAEIIQAKLWDNPTLSIEQINLWTTNSQREGQKEVIPPLFGQFGRNTQFSVELSQLIQTANKRGKLIRREKVSKEIVGKEFEELLRSLKIELRKSTSEIVYLQDYKLLIEKQLQSLTLSVESYQRMVLQGNIAKSELIRLQAAQLSVENEYYEISSELNNQLSTLKILLAFQPQTNLQVASVRREFSTPDTMNLGELISLAEDNRPDLQKSQLEVQYFSKALAYEKSLRIPDITLSANYDRRGGVWKDFIGLGVSIDLPFFNRNQGGVRRARISKNQSEYRIKQEQNKLHNEVANAFNGYVLTYNLRQKTKDEELLSELNKMMAVYGRYLLEKNISMLEYLDFVEAYKENMKIMLTVEKQLVNQFEELQYTIGIDIK